MGRSSVDAMKAWWMRAVRATREALLPRRADLLEAALDFAGFLVCFALVVE
jgi:hypothetical protein